MNWQPTKDLRCISCERPVIMEHGLNDPPPARPGAAILDVRDRALCVICTDCEAKIDDAFWRELHGDEVMP